MTLHATVKGYESGTNRRYNWSKQNLNNLVHADFTFYGMESPSFVPKPDMQVLVGMYMLT